MPMHTLSDQTRVSRFAAWRLAIRPKTLPASVSGVVVGIALAMTADHFAPLPALAALAGALLLQIAVNLANDYQDYVKGTDVPERTGPIRVAAGGLMPLSELRAGIAVVVTLAALVGLYLVLVGGWPVLVLGIAAILSALAYSGGPYPIGYHGLGDLFVFLFFGPGAVCGTYWVQAHSLSPVVVAAAMPIGTLTVAILVVNNYRDYKTDRRTGKRTLAVILGPARTRLEYIALLVVAYATPIALWIAGWAYPWVLLPILTLPLAVRLVLFLYRTPEGPALNKALAGTANLDLFFSLLLSVGFLL